MDAGTFRWVLIIIAVVLAVAIYLYGLHQTRLRKRNAIETFTREEIDSAFVEDEQLRFEMNNLNKILKDNETDENLEEFLINPAEEAREISPAEEVQEISPAEEVQEINPAEEVQEINPAEEVQEINPAEEALETPSALPDPGFYIPAELAGKDEGRLISHHLRHSDFRLIVGEEVESAVQQAVLELNAEGLLEYREEEELAFQIASLSEPGNFYEIEDLNFTTLGFNCFIDLDSCANPRLAYEAMLRKIDELVGMLNVKVYKPDHQLLTISDVTSIREKLV